MMSLPALFTRMSIFLSDSGTFDKTSATALRSCMSSTIVATSPPLPVLPALLAALAASATSFSCVSRRAVRMRLAPAWANLSAVERPMPAARKGGAGGRHQQAERRATRNDAVERAAAAGGHTGSAGDEDGLAGKAGGAGGEDRVGHSAEKAAVRGGRGEEAG